MPARNARHGKLFTWSGSINLKNEKYRLDERPIDEQCDCPTCRNFSRAYLRHLFKAEEILALRLAVMHNLYFYNKLTQRIRDALDAGEFAAFRAEYSTKLSERSLILWINPLHNSEISVIISISFVLERNLYYG